MKEIQLTKGKKALVDDADYDWLNQWKWYAMNSRGSYYACRTSVNKGIKRYILMHRLIFSGIHPSCLVDHIDGDGLNNQKSNLRSCNNKQNVRNSKPIIGTSKYKGVSFSSDRKKWQAKIKHNGNSIWIGYFDYESDAAIAYNEAAKMYHGEFARLNHIRTFDPNLINKVTND